MHPITGGFIENFNKDIVKNITIYKYNKQSKEFCTYDTKSDLNKLNKSNKKNKSNKSNKKNKSNKSIATDNNNQKKNYYDFLFIPPANISYVNLLDIYEITDIDTLYDVINNKKYNIYTINRLLNCWIYKNLSIVKKHNTKIINIYTEFFNTFKTSKREIYIKKFKDYFIDIINKPNIYNIDIYNNFLYIHKIY